MGFCDCSMFCCTLLCIHSSFAIVLMGKREMVALLFVFLVSRDCYVLFLTVPRACLLFVTVVFPDHNNFLFFLVQLTI